MYMSRGQGDQIGQIFADWVIFNFGQILEIKKIANIWATSSHG
jgi:hypothetical protein